MTAMEELSKKLGELPEGRVLAGFSGGADSTALMFLLAAARDNGRIQPEAVHVNHGLRGRKATATKLSAPDSAGSSAFRFILNGPGWTDGRTRTPAGKSGSAASGR